MRSAVLTLLLFALGLPVFSQDNTARPRPRPEWMRDMDRVMGTIVSVSEDQMVIKPEDGSDVTVNIGKDTRIRKNRENSKLSDFKLGDRVIVFGKQSDDKTFKAAMIGGGEMRPFGRSGQPPSIEDLQKMGLGTTFIAGEVKEINETRLTILRPDGQTQTIEVDESTSFRSGKGETGTLADIKVGDEVAGRGEIKNGIFVPQTLRVGGPEGRRGMGGRIRPDESPDLGPPPQQQPK